MSKKESVIQNFYFDAEAIVSITYEVFPIRVEECHGRHEFVEDEEIDRQMLNFVLNINGQMIDITERLTPEEKTMILNSEK